MLVLSKDAVNSILHLPAMENARCTTSLTLEFQLTILIKLHQLNKDQQLSSLKSSATQLKLMELI